MDHAEYDKLDRVEDRMWWFAALHRNLLQTVARAALPAADLPIVDAGCGTGGLLARLAWQYRDRPVFGLDCESQACRMASSKSGRPVCGGTVNDLPFADAALGAIFSADVLCHAGVDEVRALRQFHRCLVPGGWVILNLPAYRWLLSRHDVAVSNTRRYTATGVRRLLQAAGFRPVFVTYWNTMLFPVMVMARKLSGDAPGATSDVRLYPRPIDALCRMATNCERALLRRGLRFPFGGSIIAAAVKKGRADG